VAAILVVDDQPDACRALTRLLQHFGHDASYKTSGPDAVAYLAQRIPDLLICDVMMPGMDGLDVLRLIRSDPRLKKMPVILFSALTDPNFRAYAIGEGASDFWIKGSMDFGTLPERLAPYISEAAKCQPEGSIAGLH
jgi:CheY-like chemotaxis protein